MLEKTLMSLEELKGMTLKEAARNILAITYT
jgi:hypothetical protein